MIRLNAISYHLPQGFLYKEVSLFIGKGDKVGLCGKNGVGKSTLLNIISGQLQPSEGNVTREKGMNLAYLTQDISISSTKTVRAYLESSNTEIQDIQKRLDYVNDQLMTRTDYESEEYTAFIEDVTALNDRLTLLGAHDFAERIELVLKGLGFKSEDLDRPLSEFSGGWKMRAELARLLVNQPDVLLIDEPTNHLDIVSIQWLEDYLKAFKGGLVIISHDRRFLDNVTNRTVEVANQKLYDYKCNYSSFVVQHEEEMERLMQSKKNQDKEIKRTEDLINKYRAKASKASFAQSLIKKLDKVERIEIDSIERQAFNVRFQLASSSGKRVLDLRSVSKSYGDKHILSNLEALVSRGDKIALLGPNGVGKSTLIKSIMGDISYEGEIEYGHNVSIGYFAQDASESLDKEKTVFEVIDDVAIGEKRKDIRTILGAFLFGGDDVDKKVKVLSGGERTRLAICRLLFQDFNLLIMDEPTNHLDISSKEMLKEALEKYEGSILLVSHDRDFLDRLSNKIWEIKDGKIREHYFGVNEFLQRLKEDQTSVPKKEAVVEKKESSKLDHEQLKQMKSDLRKSEKAVKNLENTIGQLEGRIEELNKYLEQADFSDPDVYEKNAQELTDCQTKLNKAMLDWESENEKLENLQSSLAD